jgi:protein SCO1/2
MKTGLVVNNIEYLRECLFTLLIPILVFMAVSGATENKPPEIGIYEHLDKYLPDDLNFVDENHQIVNMKSSIDKPTVFALVYYECPGLCSPLLEGVADVISKAKLDLGSDYQVYTVSFDPEEKPVLARDKKSNYARLVKNRDVENGWRWFTGDSASIARLLDSFGFKIKKEGQEFVHPASLIVVSPKGKITRYLYGTYFLPFDLKMAVVEASEGKSSATINKVLKYCFSYDPEGRKYVLNFTRISGSLILFIAVSLLAGLLIKSKRKNKNLENSI